MLLGIAGHRPQEILTRGYSHPTLDIEVRRVLRHFIDQYNPDMSLVFMAQGLGMWAAQELVKSRHAWVAVVPFKKHSVVWPKKIQYRYHHLLRRANRVVYVDRTPGYIQNLNIPVDEYALHKIRWTTRYISNELMKSGESMLLTTSISRDNSDLGVIWKYAENISAPTSIITIYTEDHTNTAIVPQYAEPTLIDTR